MCVDQFVLPRLLRVRRPVEPIPEWRSKAFNWPAIVAVVAAVFFGSLGQVLLPGRTSTLDLGIVPVEAWIMAGVLFVALAASATRSRSAQTDPRLRPAPAAGRSRGAGASARGRAIASGRSSFMARCTA
jgi:hypothetical protein